MPLPQSHSRPPSRIILIIYNRLPTPHKPPPLPNHIPHPKKIWQSSAHSLLYLDESSRANIQGWHNKNPAYRYEHLTDTSAQTYVRERFADHPDWVNFFPAIPDNIMRADLIRYLVLYGEGGVYSDMDTECLKPISSWIPEVYRDRANVVLGVEYDTAGKGHVGALLDLQLCNWTILSRALHPLLYITITNALSAIAALAARQNTVLSNIAADFNDVLACTGPAQLTLSTFQYLSEYTGTNVSWQNMTGLEEGKLIGDVLILPVTAFGNGQRHSGARGKEDEQALVNHQFRGSWKKGGHDYKVVKEKEAKEKEAKEKAEKEEKWKAENQA
jgi:alpha 1,6-mannosyltransferase